MNEQRKHWERETTHWINALSQLKNDIKESAVFAPKELDEQCVDLFEQIDQLIVTLSSSGYTDEQIGEYLNSYKGFKPHYEEVTATDGEQKLAAIKSELSGLPEYSEDDRFPGSVLGAIQRIIHD